jgi:uncharacterized membrane protein
VSERERERSSAVRLARSLLTGLVFLLVRAWVLLILCSVISQVDDFGHSCSFCLGLQLGQILVYVVALFVALALSSGLHQVF